MEFPIQAWDMVKERLFLDNKDIVPYQLTKENEKDIRSGSALRLEAKAEIR